jgi:hypothetical protein
MGELRRQKVVGSGNRRAYIGSALALAAVIIAAVSIWVWNRTHREFQVSNQVAIVDLRQMSPTRGGDSAPEDTGAKAPRQTGQLRLMLPVGSPHRALVPVLGEDLLAPALGRSALWQPRWRVTRVRGTS